MSLGSTPFLLDNLHSTVHRLHSCSFPSHYWLAGRRHCRHNQLLGKSQCRHKGKCRTFEGSTPFLLDKLHRTMQHLHRCRPPSRCWLSGRRRYRGRNKE